MIVNLIRHGETAPEPPNSFYGGTEVPLSENGKRQAQLAALTFKEVELDGIICSPLSRAVYGAERVQLQHPNLEIIEHSGLREIDRGRWVGHDLASVKASFPGDWDMYLNDPLNWRGHGGESLMELYVRVQAAFDEINQWKLSNIAIVAHLFPIRAIVSKTVDLSLEEQMLKCKIATASISSIARNEDGVWKPRYIGQIPY